MQPLLSIVIANYNYGRFLEEAIQSVLSQSCQDYELIVVDGGSTDNSVEIIKKYEDKIAWWVSEKDEGQSDAFNKGFAHAKGKFGFWLNADDAMMPGSIEAIIRYLSEHPKCEWLAGSTVYGDENLNIWRCSRCVKVWSFLGKFAPASPVNGPSSIFLLENLRSVGGFDITAHYVMDVDLWRRFWKCGIKLNFIKKYVWCFRLHEQSKTASTITEHKVKNRTTGESDSVNLRYGATKRVRKVSEWINRFQRLISGTYFHSYVDTKKYKGRNFKEICN